MVATSYVATAGMLLATVAEVRVLGTAVSSRGIDDVGKAVVLQKRYEDNPSMGTYVGRSWHSAIQMGSYVYIDGGEVCSTGVPICNTYVNYWQMNSTLSFPVDNSWDSSNLVISQTEKETDVPKLLGSNLIAPDTPDAKQFYQIEGMRSLLSVDPPPTNGQFWKYTTDGTGGGSWGIEMTANQNVWNGFSRVSENAWASSRTKGFDIGGVSSVLSDPTLSSQYSPVPGLRVYDFNSNMWSNEATPFASGATISNAVATWAPNLGDKDEGLLIVIGGALVNQPYATFFDRPETYRGFDKVDLYDPKTKKWYSQTATGDVPTKRVRPCIVGMASDKGTYEIYMYGGLQLNSTNYEYAISKSLFVLSIPAFEWFSFNADGAVPRSHHACVVPRGTSNMISIGGRLLDGSPTDPAPNGVYVLDLYRLTWSNQFDANSGKYQSPRVIGNWYDGGNLGSVSWNNDQTKSLFIASNSDPLNPNPANPTNSTDSTDSTDETYGGLSGGAIGGIVGGVSGALVVAVAFWFIFCRGPRKSNNGRGNLGPNQGQPPPMGTAPMPQSQWPQNQYQQQYGGVPAQYDPRMAHQQHQYSPDTGNWHIPAQNGSPGNNANFQGGWPPQLQRPGEAAEFPGGYPPVVSELEAQRMYELNANSPVLKYR